MSTFETSIYTGGNTPASNLQESQGSNVDNICNGHDDNDVIPPLCVLSPGVFIVGDIYQGNDCPICPAPELIVSIISV